MDFYAGDPPPLPAASGGASAGGFAGAGVAGGGFGGAGAAGAAGLAGASGVAGAAGTVGDGRCSPAIDPGSAMSYTLNTTGPACIRVQQDIRGWGCSNAGDRTVTVNGVLMPTCSAPLPPKLSGSYYFDVSAGSLTYASIYWF